MLSLVNSLVLFLRIPLLSDVYMGYFVSHLLKLIPNLRIIAAYLPAQFY
jgi:beta-lactamase regulating signal transducer with metallopeptidase domain